MPEPMQPTFFVEDKGIGTICATQSVVENVGRLGWRRDRGVKFAKIGK
jgi:hypothetical protein